MSAATITVKPGVKSSEHWLTWAIILIGIAVLVTSPLWWGRAIALPCMTTAVAFYAHNRTKLKLAANVIEQAGEECMSLVSIIQSSLAGLDPDNIEASIDSAIESYIAKKAPSTSKLQPEMDAAIVADMALAKKVFAVYALTKASGVLAAPLAKLALDIPASAPAVMEIQKLLGLA